MMYLWVLILSAAIFLAVISCIVRNSQKNQFPALIFFIISSVAGLACYGSCYAWYAVTDGGGALAAFTAMFSTVLNVGVMFTGSYNGDVLNDVPFMKHPAAQFCFWLSHFLAYYTVAGAALNIFGAGMLRRVQYAITPFRRVDLIYNVSDDTLELGQKLMEQNSRGARNRYALAYVGSGSNPDAAKAVSKAGGLLYDTAASPSLDLIRRLHLKKDKTRLHFYAVSRDYDRNLNYAHALLSQLEDVGVSPEQTSLVMLGQESGNGDALQAVEQQYGYGNVRIFDGADLPARVLIQRHPVSELIRFDENAKALNDVHALLVGFSELGQAVLRKLTASGQFEGSTFHAYVFDPDLSRIGGLFRSRYQAMCKEYDIRFLPFAGQSGEMAEFLDGRMENFPDWKTEKLNYIVVALENPAESRETALDIGEYLKERGRPLPVYVCNRDSVTVYQPDNSNVEHWSLFQADFLHSDEMDRRAMQINNYYCNGTDMEAEWKKCRYFDRVSSRASADYLFPLLKQTSLGMVPSDPKVRENLARSEHRRWCAFMYSMGFSTMSEEERESRAKLYQRDHSVRMTKDMEGKKHACLVPWEDLAPLSAWENEVMKEEKVEKTVDYQKYDYEIVDAVADMLRQSAE